MAEGLEVRAEFCDLCRSSAPSGGLQAFGDDDVRAPIPAKLDRLYGDMPYYPSSRPNGQADQISQHAFRDSE